MQYYDANTFLYLNGKFVKAGEASTDLYSQSLHYGYAVFEGIKSYHTHNGTRIFKAREHYERLKRSAELMHISFPYSVEDLIKQTYKLLEKNKLKDAYIRPLVYCDAHMGLSPGAKPSIVICAWEWGAYLGTDLQKVCISSYQRPNPNSTHIEAKASGHYINSILATAEAKSKGYDEAILLDMNNHIAEASGANIFIEKNGKLYTPSLGHILPGITRASVIRLCKTLDIECIEKQISVEELKAADSAFLCGTAAEIAGIATIDDTRLPILWTESIGATIQRTYKALVLEKQNYEVII